MTLSEELERRGIVHRRDDMTETDCRRVWFDSEGKLIGRFTAEEGWRQVQKAATRDLFSNTGN